MDGLVFFSHQSSIVQGHAYRMWQNSGQMCKVALVQGKQALRLYRARQTIKGRRVQVARLIVHARHDCIRGMHDAAHDEAAGGATRNVQRHALLHTKMLDQTPLYEKIRGKLDRAAESRADHGWAHTSVEAFYAFSPIYLPHAVKSVAVMVLCAYG